VTRIAHARQTGTPQPAQPRGGVRCALRPASLLLDNTAEGCANPFVPANIVGLRPPLFARFTSVRITKSVCHFTSSLSFPIYRVINLFA
jgi:hypothetical protein